MLDDNIINYDIDKERGIRISGGQLSQFWGDSNSCVVMIKVKPIFTKYIVTHKLRNIESGSWDYTISAKPSDEIEFKITYEGIGTDSSKKDGSGNGGDYSILIKEQLADGLEYVVGSTSINDVHEKNDTVCGDGIPINDKNVTITFRAMITDQAVSENECRVIVDNTCVGSATVIVDNSGDRKLLTVNEDGVENCVSYDSEDNANDILTENTFVNAAPNVALKKDTAASSNIVNNNEQPETDYNIKSVITADDESEDTSPIQIRSKEKNDKKPFRIKLYIFAAAAIAVVAVIIALFPRIKALLGGNATSDDASDSLSSYDKNISDSSSPTYESSTSEGTSVSTNIPNLEIKTPEGLIREVNGDGRTSYTMYQVKRGILGNKIVFNSISNSESIGGDERNFIAACENTANPSAAANKWSTSDVAVEDGKEYVIRLYVHNNNPGGLDAVATNTKVAFGIPGTSAKQVQVDGFISSDNAEPNIYWGHINFIANQAFHLEYVQGSALLENDGIGKNGGIKLGDNIITQKTNKGVLIGYDDLDGCVPGGYEYHNYVTIRVKSVFDTDYKIDNEVRLVDGAEIWGKTVNANVGDIVEFRVSYTNLSKTEVQNDVAIKHILPKSLRYVDGTTKLINSTYPDGTHHFANGSIVGNGINIGAYKPYGNAYVYFRAEVIEDGLVSGKNTLYDWAQCGGVGVKTIQDYASVVVDKP